MVSDHIDAKSKQRNRLRSRLLLCGVIVFALLVAASFFTSDK